VALFALGLLAMDAAVVVALGTEQPREEAAAPASGSDVDLDWALCQTQFEGHAVTPVTVAVTYLDGDKDAAVTPEQIRGWFGDIDGAAVHVSQLEYRNGRRRVALELNRDNWSEWTPIVGRAAGRDVCGRLRAALIERGIGRPNDAADPDRSRYDYEFIYERRSKLYRSVSWTGTLEDLAQAEQFDSTMQWLRDGAPVP